MVKRLLKLLSCTFIALGSVIACQEKNWEDTYDVIITSEDEVAFSYSGGVATISVASVSDWEAQVSTTEWLTAEKSSGKLILKASENATLEARAASVTLTSPVSSKEIKVYQACNVGATILNVSAPEVLNFDSEGESFEFNITSNKSVTLSSDVDWLKLELSGEVAKVSALVNEGEHRKGKISVSCEGAETVEIAVEQISREENAYLQMLGYFGLGATSWVMNGQVVNTPGIGSYCTIEQVEYRKSFLIKDLFMKGSEIEASFDERSDEMLLNLGGLCLNRVATTGEKWFFYFTKINAEDRSFNSGMIKARIATVTDPESNQSVSAIVFDEMDPAFPYLGLVGMSGMQYAMLGDVPYAGGTVSLIRRTQTTDTSAE